jgi:hypothetical protein
MKKRLQQAIARYAGICADCRKAIVLNAPIYYDWDHKRTICKPCGDFKMKQVALFDDAGHSS